MFKFLLSICSIFSSSAFAYRTAIFDESIKNRAVVWQDQKNIFTKETPKEKERPIWLHAGDSIATSYANQQTLKERLARAEEGPLSEPNTIEDYSAHFPSPRFTWYAGTEIGVAFEGSELSVTSLGLLGWLDAKLSLATQGVHKEWVLLSTALAGSYLSPFERDNDLKAILQVKEPERVKLLSMSLGGNDLCASIDPLKDEQSVQEKGGVPLLRKKLQEIKAYFPNAKLVAWDIPNLKEVRDNLFVALSNLPASQGKERLQAYCMQQWTETSCPAFAKDKEGIHMEQTRKSITNALTEEWGATLDVVGDASKKIEPLDMIAADCFHPSRLAQKYFAEAMAKFIED